MRSRKAKSLVLQQLTRLNALVWPAIWASASQLIVASHEHVVVLDAAVLVEAGWHEHCDEVWAAIVPRKEAVRRIVDRNKCDEQTAAARIDAQISNSERVRHANVVLCSLWEYERTRTQVQHAWQLLQGRLPADVIV